MADLKQRFIKYVEDNNYDISDEDMAKAEAGDFSFLPEERNTLSEKVIGAAKDVGKGTLDFITHPVTQGVMKAISYPVDITEQLIRKGAAEKYFPKEISNIIEQKTGFNPYKAVYSEGDLTKAVNPARVITTKPEMQISSGPERLEAAGVRPSIAKPLGISSDIINALYSGRLAGKNTAGILKDLSSTFRRSPVKAIDEQLMTLKTPKKSFSSILKEEGFSGDLPELISRGDYEGVSKTTGFIDKVLEKNKNVTDNILEETLQKSKAPTISKTTRLTPKEGLPKGEPGIVKPSDMRTQDVLEVGEDIKKINLNSEDLNTKGINKIKDQILRSIDADPSNRYLLDEFETQIENIMSKKPKNIKEMKDLVKAYQEEAAKAYDVTLTKQTIKPQIQKEIARILNDKLKNFIKENNPEKYKEYIDTMRNTETLVEVKTGIIPAISAVKAGKSLGKNISGYDAFLLSKSPTVLGSKKLLEYVTNPPASAMFKTGDILGEISKNYTPFRTGAGIISNTVTRGKTSE